MRNSLSIIFLFLLVACGGKEKLPAGIMPAEKMQAVLWDMIRADQFLSDYVLNHDSTLRRYQESLPYYQEILALHQVSQEDFRASFYYYRERPQLMKVIMDSISQKKTLQVDTTVPKLAIDTMNRVNGGRDTSKAVTPREPIRLD